MGISKFVIHGASLLLAISTTTLSAQEKHADSAHSKHTKAHHSSELTSILPTEQGQSGFAAIAEIVGILNENPATDWSKVDISALQKHLVDMDELTMNSSVKASYKAAEAKFIITGKDRTLVAIQSMVPAHATELSKMDVWNAEGIAIKDGAILTVNVTDSAMMVKVKALGFYGLMATGAHHQKHHLAIAQGDMHIH